MFVLIVIPFLLILVYLFMLRGRAKHSGWQFLQGWAYAHRGLYADSVPENSLEAFRLAKEHGYGIELDVHLLKDGTLAVIHDTSLQRTAGADVPVNTLTYAQLKQYTLEGTQEQIPTLPQVLHLIGGAVPLIVELKTDGNNVDGLCSSVCALLENYCGAYCIESFDPRCIAWLRKNRPQILRGQLSANFLIGESYGRPWALRFAMTTYLVNISGRPDFIAYDFPHRKRLGIFLCRKLWGIQGVAWTIRSQADLDIALQEGWIPIFEGFCP